MPVMWMVKTVNLAPGYGVAYRKKHLVEKLNERKGPRSASDYEIVKVWVELYPSAPRPKPRNAVIPKVPDRPKANLDGAGEIRAPMSAGIDPLPGIDS